MTKNLTLDPQDLFAELIDLARAQGITEDEQWHELVDTLLEEKLQVGEADEDNPIPTLKTTLIARWSEAKEALGIA